MGIEGHVVANPAVTAENHARKDPAASADGGCLANADKRADSGVGANDGSGMNNCSRVNAAGGKSLVSAEVLQDEDKRGQGVLDLDNSMSVAFNSSRDNGGSGLGLG